MGTQITAFNAQLPAHLKARAELSETAKALIGNAGGGKRISIKNGVWRLLDNGKEIAQVEERYLDVVIVKAAPKVSRVFYAGKYDAANTAPPDCWSADGDTPDASIKEPCAATCAKCENNVAGSGQGNSRACRFQQRIAVVTASDLIEHGEEAAVMNFTVPATSLFGKAEGDKRPLQEYARWLVAQKVSPEMLITRMKFDTSDEAEGQKVIFKPMRWLEQDEFDAVEKLALSEDATKAVTMTVAQTDGVKSKVDDEVEGKRPVSKAKPAPAEDDDAPAPAKTRAKAKPAPAEDEDEAPAPTKAKAKPAPADDEDEAPAPAKAKAKAKPAPAEDEDEAPAVRKTKEKPEPAAAADLASVVDGWDD
jgi:hypothetical protein